MLVYGPLLCLCAIAAFTLANFYSLSTKAWELYKDIQKATSNLAYWVVPSSVRTKLNMFPEQTREDPGAGTGWSTFPQLKNNNNNPQPGNWGTNNRMY